MTKKLHIPIEIEILVSQNGTTIPIFRSTDIETGTWDATKLSKAIKDSFETLRQSEEILLNEKDH